MSAIKATNDGVRFLLELAMLAAFAVWGASVNLTTAIVAPLVVAAVWGMWLAPRSDRRLSERARIPLEIGLFGFATAALVAADHTTAAIVFGAIAAVNTALVHLWDE